ncbi:hypothetical protein HMPREF3214_00951 [Alloscardovia omnicolens]|uniref:Uncharacterized protein n=1 Tax=Alloscardovia omnicolens F0580 TaxID=1321816 RepID=U1QR68_9BIFI|nr:hypothetical protein HMPREF9244_01429 [Alloscardovia omnicolens F0580]KWZ74104.1 hypothetical protein HMPREF3214_00951 [Alloscardovia omnicolens]
MLIRSYAFFLKHSYNFLFVDSTARNAHETRASLFMIFERFSTVHKPCHRVSLL